MQDFGDQLAALRPMLLDFARRMLRNDAWAEDAVSETLVAALEKPQGYRGSASISTWLVAILKHKAVDQIRHHTRELQAPEADGDAPPAWGFDPAGAAGLWAAAGGYDPHDRLLRQQFLSELHLCVESLPPRVGRAFVLRNAMERETAEICAELGVSKSHLGVMLHRANRRLRDLLHGSWAPAKGEAQFT